MKFDPVRGELSSRAPFTVVEIAGETQRTKRSGEVSTSVASDTTKAVHVISRQKFILRQQQKGGTGTAPSHVSSSKGDAECDPGSVFSVEKSDAKMMSLIQLCFHLSIKALVLAVLFVRAVAPSKAGCLGSETTGPQNSKNVIWRKQCITPSSRVAFRRLPVLQE